jgi:general secretion pathway protein E
MRFELSFRRRAATPEPEATPRAAALPPNTLLTAEGGILDSGEHLRSVAAIFADGRFLVSDSHKDDPVVASAAAVARRLGVPLQEPALVSIEQIHACYKGYGDRTARAIELDTRARRDVTSFIAEMAARRISDIHILVERDKTTIRLRENGTMRPWRTWTAEEGHRFCRAIWTMTDSSDAQYQELEHQGAQVSNPQFLPDSLHSLRLAYAALAYGGRGLVIRLHPKRSAGHGRLTDLGFTPAQAEDIARMHARPVGGIIDAGPTGSGKTTTLTQLLINILAERNYEVSAWAIQDPVEVVIEGVGQMTITDAQTDEQRAEKFSKAIRAALRQDPDILYIGEIRDHESARLAMQASMSGHLMMTTLHTYDAISILDRLRDIGVETFKLTDPTLVTGLISQRLLQRLCPHCSLPADERTLLPEQWLRLRVRCPDVSGIHVRGHGCAKCRGGIVGRTVVAETIVPDETFMQLIRAERKQDAFQHWIQALGGKSIMDVAVDRMLQGEFDPRTVEHAFGRFADAPFAAAPWLTHAA